MRAAIVGLGRMGIRHLQVLQELNQEVAGAFDQFDGARDNAKTQIGLPEEAIFTDVQVMFERIRPELVVIATTAPSHADLVCMAAEFGATAIICEKPMATSLDDCDRMIRACEVAGTRLAVNHQMRFMDQYVKVKALIDDASFGGLGSMNVVAGNFGMAMNGSHYFEAFRYLSDEMPVSVAAWFSAGTVTNPRGAQFEDRAGSIRIATASGKRFYMDASTDQGHGMFVSYGGPQGRLDVDELAGRAHLVIRKAEHREMPTTRYGMPYDEHDIQIAPADAVAPTRSVLDALLKGENYPDGAVGRMAVEILAAAYASNEQGGRTIELSSAALPRDRNFPWA